MDISSLHVQIVYVFLGVPSESQYSRMHHMEV